MPKDKNGCEIKEGDVVNVPCKVECVYAEGAMFDIGIALLHPKPGTHSQRMSAAGCEVVVDEQATKDQPEAKDKLQEAVEEGFGDLAEKGPNG